MENESDLVFVETPFLAISPAMKLKAKLETYGASVFVVPDNLKASVVSTGDGHLVSASAEIPVYHLKASEAPASSLRRRDVFEQVDKAYGDSDLTTPLSAFLSEQGHLIERETRADTIKLKPSFRPKFLSVGGVSIKSAVDQVDDDNTGLNLLDITEVSQFGRSPNCGYAVSDRTFVCVTVSSASRLLVG
jgi:hypothetical protein